MLTRTLLKKGGLLNLAAELGNVSRACKVMSDIILIVPGYKNLWQIVIQDQNSY